MSRSWPAIVALIGGVVLGVLAGVTRNQGGFAALGALLYVAIGALIVLALGVLTVGAVFASRRRLAETAFLSGVALVIGAVLAGAAFTVLVPRPQQPVYLVAMASGTLDLDAAGFRAADRWTAVCGSRANSSALQQITIRDLGQLNSATLRAYMTVPETGVTSGIAFFVDVGEPAITLGWHGNVGLDLTNGGVSGTATFAALPLDQVPNATPTDDWPSSLSGVLHWTCDPWLPPGSYLE